jgi:hypothetical protein
MDDNIIEIGKWIGGGVAWILSISITYRLGRKSKIDDIRINKLHEYAQIIVSVLSKDFNERKDLVESYERNFNHFDEIEKAVDAFEIHTSLYKDMRNIIIELPKNIDKLEEKSRNAKIYFDLNLIKDIEGYVKTTRFSYISDGMNGLMFNTYCLSFFKNLLDQENIIKRKKLYDNILSKLRESLK